MKAQLQCLEGLAGDDEFAVQDKAISLQSGEASDDLREETVERPLLLGLQINLVAVAKGKTAKAVIFGFVEPALAAREVIDRFGFHRLKRQRNG